MSKRPSLAESMRAVATAPAPEPAAPPEEGPPPAPKAVPKVHPQPVTTTAHPAEHATGYYAATRVGKKKATAPLNIAAHRQLKSLALEQDESTVEKLLLEAINDLFRKYGKPPIA
jgi:hypothetical protein